MSDSTNSGKWFANFFLIMVAALLVVAVWPIIWPFAVWAWQTPGVRPIFLLVVFIIILARPPSPAKRGDKTEEHF